MRATPPTEPTPSGDPPAATPRPQDLQVLVVDDEEDILELLGEYLRARGYALRTAYDGQDALEILQSGQADIVLTDMKMPHLGGLELLDAAREMSRPVAVILMTGFGTVESATRALTRGAYDFLLKPFKLRDVHTALTRAADRLAKERQAAHTRALLEFYEMAHAVNDPEQLPRLYGVLASVARDETGAAEVALWRRGPGGWEAAARGGAVHRLDRSVTTERSEPFLDDDVAVVPLFVDQKREAVLAVAGGRSRRDEDLKRLEELGGVLAFAMERCAAGS